MKVISLLFLVSLNVLAVEVPVENFDQSKLETILRKIPSALMNSQDMGDFVRKSYRFPTSKSQFSIYCAADYYAASTIPTSKKCTITISDKADLKGDEYLFKMSNSSQVTELFESLSYGKSYSHERVYGQAYDGSYRNLFRFMIACKRDTCELRFTPKEAY